MASPYATFSLKKIEQSDLEKGTKIWIKQAMITLRGMIEHRFSNAYYDYLGENHTPIMVNTYPR